MQVLALAILYYNILRSKLHVLQAFCVCVVSACYINTYNTYIVLLLHVFCAYCACCCTCVVSTCYISTYNAHIQALLQKQCKQIMQHSTNTLHALYICTAQTRCKQAHSTLCARCCTCAVSAYCISTYACIHKCTYTVHNACMHAQLYAITCVFCCN